MLSCIVFLFNQLHAQSHQQAHAWHGALQHPSGFPAEESRNRLARALCVHSHAEEEAIPAQGALGFVEITNLDVRWCGLQFASSELRCRWLSLISVLETQVLEKKVEVGCLWSSILISEEWKLSSWERELFLCYEKKI